jgi:hypothetical protein
VYSKNKSQTKPKRILRRPKNLKKNRHKRKKRSQLKNLMEKRANQNILKSQSSLNTTLKLLLSNNLKLMLKLLKTQP